MSDDTSRSYGNADPNRIRTRQDFARELTLLRERAGLTVRDVARAMDVPDSTIGGYFAGRHLPPVKPPDLLRAVVNICGVKESDVIEEWLAALSRVRRAPGKRPADAPIPYRGLASFQTDDADWFYGRQNLTDGLIALLGRQRVDGGIFIVAGPSGSGKSSLLRAGMIPALRAGALGVPGSDTWPIALLVPGEQPLHELAAHLAKVTGADKDALLTAMRSYPENCSDLTHRAVERSADAGRSDGYYPSRLVIVVDQFEEIFTACPDELERHAFITALCAAARPASDRTGACVGEDDGDLEPAALVVLGLRADFYAYALRYPELVPALQDGQVVVGPMTETELRSAIVEPAHKAKLEIEDGLVELLLRDIAPAPAGASSGAAPGAGTLPLLSHALLATWERSHRGIMTVADYRSSGGIHGAVARSAEQVFEALTDTQKNLARRIFVRLVHVADDTADTRRRVARNELLLSDGDAQHVLDFFIDERLVTAETDEVEIAHEALLFAWPRLRAWIDADRAGLRTHRQLTVAAEIWRDSGRDHNALYRGGRLATARDWTADATRHDDLNDLEREFLDASIQYRIAEERTARRRTRRLHYLVAALASLLLLAGFLSVFAFQQKTAATQQRDLAISRQVAIDANNLRTTDVALAMQLSLAAYRIAPTPEARSSLLDSYVTPAVTRILGPPGVMQSVAFTSNGRIMAAGGEDSTIRLWNLADEDTPIQLGRPLTGQTNTVYSLAFSPDGRTLASGSGFGDNTLRLWDVTKPDKAAPWGTSLTGRKYTVYSVAFSPDGRILAAGSSDDTIRLWNVANPANPIPLGLPLRGPSGYAQSVAFSPNGKLLAAGSADHNVWLWNVSDPAHPIRTGPPLTGPANTVFSVAFSPDSRILAAGSADNKVWLWNITKPSRPVRSGPPLTGPTGFVNSVAFSPDGLTLAAASSDSKLWVWNLANRHITSTLPHPGPVTTVTFLHNNTVATSAADGVARVWTIPGPVINGPDGPVFTATFASNHTIAVTGIDNTARLWDVADPRQPIPLGPILTDATRSGRASGAAALSPDGHTLVVGSINGSCQIWNMRNPARPIALARLSGPTKVVQSIAFSPDGRILAIASSDWTTWLWNISDPAHPAALGRPLTGPRNVVYSPAFSPDGRTLAVGGADKLVHLWNITDPSRPAPLNPPLAGANSYVNSVAFSPDGRTLAAGGADDEIRLWNVTDPAHPTRLGQPLRGPANYVDSVAFSPDGQTLAASAGDGSIWLWNVTAPSRPQLLATLTGPSGAVYTDAFDTKRDILATAGADSTVRLWNINPGQVAAFVCSVAGDQITRTEWNKYIPGLPYHPPC